MLSLFCLIYPVALFGLALASIIMFSEAARKENLYYWNPKPDYFAAFCVLVPTVVGYLVPVLCFGYTVLYMLKFIRLVERNFDLVPRNRVFSNMIYVRNLGNSN